LRPCQEEEEEEEEEEEDIFCQLSGLVYNPSSVPAL